MGDGAEVGRRESHVLLLAQKYGRNLLVGMNEYGQLNSVAKDG